MKKNLLAGALAVATVFSACKKDDVTKPDPITPAKGVYVLSEGGFGGNNTKLSYRNASTGTFAADYFLQQNPSLAAGLGDLGNDMIIYGGKIYIVMNGSGNVTVLNAASGALITKISFGGTAANRNPRYALGTGGKVYVTAWDNKVSIVDTSTLAITGNINVGATPEGLAASGNFLYVANSGGLNYPDYDSTVSVVDLTTGAEIKKVTVGLNPQRIEVNSKGKVYVSAYGDAFATVAVPASVSVINSTSNTLETTLGSGYEYDHIRIYNDIAYLYNNYGGTAVKMYNTVTNTLVRNSFVTDGTAVASTYGVNIDEQNGDVYIMDAKDFVASGEVTCFGSDGVKKFSFSVAPGVNPNKVIFAR